MFLEHWAIQAVRLIILQEATGKEVINVLAETRDLVNPERGVGAVNPAELTGEVVRLARARGQTADVLSDDVAP